MVIGHIMCIVQCRSSWHHVS